MKPVYQAAHGFDAHMVKDLLEDAGIAAQVRGEYLQGALGEIPVSGMVTVWVADADTARARELVLDWEQSVPEADMDAEHEVEPEAEREPPRRSSRPTALIAALLLVPLLWWVMARVLG